MNLDPLLLSRLQFVWVVAWHILLPAFTVGLASYIAVLEGLHLATGREIYFRLSSFWIKMFAVSFGMGVVSGIVMPFQFGTNWSRFSDATANVLSPLLAYEGLTAFFLESAFLGVLLFGRKLVPRWAHFVAAFMVAAGTLFSTFWILATNSWMQTPAGYEIIDGRFFPKDWLQIIFNPSFPYRLAHTVVAFYVTTGFVVVGVAAYLIRRGRFVEEGRIMLSMTLWLLTVLVPLQILIGDQHGLNTLEHQPAKLAAIEARWETASGVPLTLFAIPDEAAEMNRYAIEIPDLGSLILTHDPNGTVRGLKDWPADQRPHVALPFFAFRIMVGLGLLMLALVAVSCWL
ncbi:MAG: cytochrome bd ubiquinol oxidase subunit, partial [Rhodospirillaceae bacterium]|nr:cytochrome bd ubiquinol oxidase subunit [Rhodospirillaceae bacterium]